MIHISLGREHPVDPEVDDLNRTRVGYSPAMSDDELYEANHGCWKLGPRALNEKYYLASFEGIVMQAVEIHSIEPAPKRPERSVIHGTILEDSHPVYDKYVGKPSPVQGVRNPITYIDNKVSDATPCRCGCGGSTSGRAFLIGHDQTALHACVKEIGTVSEFLDWFAVVRQPAKTAN